LRYLLINHVPFGRGSADGSYLVGDMWLEDLRAQANAIHDAGMELTVSTPTVDKLDLASSGSFNAVEIRPQEHGFRYEPLPFYISMKQFWKQRAALTARLAEVIANADIVQIGYGGHPVALGEIAWPIARKQRRRVVWVFDGADPFPRLELHAKQQKNPIKRMAQQWLVRRFAGVCRDAIGNADLVFAHNAAVVERFKDVWDPRRCHAFDRSFVTDETLISDAELAERQRRLRDDFSPLRLVAAGRQIAIKGTDHVLRAMRQAIDRGTKLQLNVMGEGEDLQQFKSLSTELGLSDVVRFSGTVPYGKPLLDAWEDEQVMMITNLTAEISRNVLLAMARGLAVIMYANPGTDELIKRSGAGILVPTGDVDALSRALEQAARNREQLVDMCSRGLELARANTLDATHRRRAELAAGLAVHPVPH
jgi:glycosyltransferase involved in cell wall biosynthesis